MNHLFAVLLANHAASSSSGLDILPARLTVKDHTERSKFISIQVQTITAEILALRQHGVIRLNQSNIGFSAEIPGAQGPLTRSSDSAVRQVGALLQPLRQFPLDRPIGSALS
jgi:hypothetical protein